MALAAVLPDYATALRFHLTVVAAEATDHDILEVLNFYKCYRAYVRGKVKSFRLDDPHMPEKEKEEAKRRAAKYFDLSYRYAEKF